LDINIVYPVAPDKCTVVFNYFFTPDAAADPAFVASSLASSHQVRNKVHVRYKVPAQYSPGSAAFHAC